MEISPPYEQIHLLELFSAGFPPTITVEEPGAHGAAQAGIQGIGVSTPRAAAVAAATVGLARLEHIPNIIGGLGVSIMVAIGKFMPVTVVCDVTVSGAGATPMCSF